MKTINGDTLVAAREVLYNRPDYGAEWVIPNKVSLAVGTTERSIMRQSPVPVVYRKKRHADKQPPSCFM